MKVITVNRSTALVNCELNLSLSYIILLSLFHAKTFSFREVSLVLDGRGLYGHATSFEIFCFCFECCVIERTQLSLTN